MCVNPGALPYTCNFVKKSGQSISNGALMDIRVSYLKTIKSINAKKHAPIQFCGGN